MLIACAHAFGDSVLAKRNAALEHVAIGHEALPFPVPQDNEVFAQMSELTIAVQPPMRKATAPPANAASKKKR